MDNNITRILKLASEKPDYQALSNYLISRRQFPQIQPSTFNTATYGNFEAPDINTTKSGLININRLLLNNPSDAVPTVMHELTHATYNQLGNQYYEVKNKQNKTDLDKQFLDNYEKILKNENIQNQIKQISPDFEKKEENYRATSKEALAHAVENVNVPKYLNPDWSAPSHVDPTIATQLMLLLEQAQRVQNQQPASQGR